MLTVLVGTLANRLSAWRDPDRLPGQGRFLAAADGVVQSIRRLDDGRTRVATYMRVPDVHVNRAPAAGVVLSVTAIAGRHRLAFTDSSDRNASVVWHFATELGDLELIQISGTVFRRIVPFVRAGDPVRQGQRIGYIRFGSRVDVYLPCGVAPVVRVGQRVRAGETRLDRG
jgi:phosphatidylserine decarboxylase